MYDAVVQRAKKARTLQASFRRDLVIRSLRGDDDEAIEAPIEGALRDG
jgi:hypothetical protein